MIHFGRIIKILYIKMILKTKYVFRSIDLKILIASFIDTETTQPRTTSKN